MTGAKMASPTAAQTKRTQRPRPGRVPLGSLACPTPGGLLRLGVAAGISPDLLGLLAQEPDGKHQPEDEVQKGPKDQQAGVRLKGPGQGRSG